MGELMIVALSESANFQVDQKAFCDKKLHQRNIN